MSLDLANLCYALIPNFYWIFVCFLLNLLQFLAEGTFLSSHSRNAFPTQMSALLLQCSGRLAENFGMKNK